MLSTTSKGVQANLLRFELVDLFMAGLPSTDKLQKRRHQPLAVIKVIALYAEPNRAFRAVLYSVMDALGRKNRTSYYGKRKRAQVCGVSTKTVQRAIKVFKDRGWIMMSKRFTGKGSYFVHDIGVTAKLIEDALAGPGANARRWGKVGAEADQKTSVQGGPTVPSGEVHQSPPGGAGSPPEGGLPVPLTKKEVLTGESELAAQEGEPEEAAATPGSQPSSLLAQQAVEDGLHDAIKRNTSTDSGVTVSGARGAQQTVASNTVIGSCGGQWAGAATAQTTPVSPVVAAGRPPCGGLAQTGAPAEHVADPMAVGGAPSVADSPATAGDPGSDGRGTPRVEYTLPGDEAMALLDHFNAEFRKRKGRSCIARFSAKLVNAAIGAHGLVAMKLAADAMLDYSKAKDIGLNLLCSPKSLPLWLERACRALMAAVASAGAPPLMVRKPSTPPPQRIPDIGHGRRSADQFGFTVDMYPPGFTSQFDPFRKGRIKNLLLHGPAGCGKSSLGLALGMELNGNEPLYSELLSYQRTPSNIPGNALYLQRERFHQLASDSSWIPNTSKENVGSNAGGTGATWFCDLVQYVGILVLDDCLTSEATVAECRMLSAIIRDRFTGSRPTIIVTNLNQDQIRAKLDEATCSRLFDRASSQFVSFEGYDRRQLDVDMPDAGDTTNGAGDTGQAAVG